MRERLRSSEEDVVGERARARQDRSHADGREDIRVVRLSVIPHTPTFMHMHMLNRPPPYPHVHASSAMST